MYFNNIPDEFRKDNFEISGRHYYWMTIDEMEKKAFLVFVKSDILKNSESLKNF